MTGRNDTPENRQTAREAAAKQEESLDLIEHFDDIESIYVRGFEDGSIWIADYIEPSRGHVSEAALSVTWQTLVIFRDIALERNDFERVAFLSAAVNDMATLLESMDVEMPKIHDERELDGDVTDEEAEQAERSH
ncbi:hypothetical protein PBI_DEWDROP_136 [Microbacterium phage Dewdrop]|nr:hypothetical protein PBI_LEAF_136 [Microbacterium phage Leaf]QGZ17504.1 hypothetical protein PBI_DEWDROP_136 [Microbacterium phage Dewdrop]